MRRPVAVCTLCDKYSTNISSIGNECNRELPNGNRCKGVFFDANKDEDWIICQRCNGQGCVKCQFCGYLFVD